MSDKPQARASRRTPAPKKTSIAASIAVVVLVLGYMLLQPVIERRFGIELPRIGRDQPPAAEKLPAAKSPTPTATRETPAATKDQDQGILRDVGRGVKESPAGLRYAPGSQEGHRLDHVMRHAQDQPNRPGKHGVFEGDQREILTLIDEAYLAAKRGDRGVRRQRDGPRTIYTVDLQRRVGYVGGQVGRQRNHPAARGVRLVLEGSNVISAYPVQP